MGKLFMRGVPLDRAHLFSDDDSISQGYIASQRVFNTLRGEGSPLLPETNTLEDVGPAPYLRKSIIATLVQYVTNEKPLILSDDNARINAEAHLALIESIAKGINNTKDAPTEITLSETVDIPNFGATLSDRADWLSTAILKSIVRGNRRKDHETAAEFKSTAADPVLRLAEESAYWRGIPAHGSKELNGAVVGATLLTDAAASPVLDFDTLVSIKKQLTELATSGDDWENDSKQLLKISAFVPSLDVPPTTDPEYLRLSVLKKVLSIPPSNVDNLYTGYVLNPTNTRTCISTDLDVMRNYVYQSV